ncbi:hypothetical protein VTL71DRAFT_410 [Oculimacula yallundae]|uniref:Uncharacterized protein n=1 Tax=Oculimacula yallundae TaxID=86028 RepID=A0ABR4D0X3_9HELO
MTQPTGKRRLREIVRKLIQRFKESKNNLIQRKRNSILAYRALRNANVAGFLANPQRNTRWGTLIPQAIAVQLDIPRSPPRNEQDAAVSERRLETPHPRGAGFVEEFSPTRSLIQRSDSPPGDFVRNHTFAYRATDLQTALSASRLPTDPQEDEMDDLYFILMAHVHEPMEESEPLLPGRRHPTPRRRPDGEDGWRAVQDSVTMFVKDNIREIRYSPESISSPTPTPVDRPMVEPSGMRRREHLSNLRLEYSASDLSLESEQDQNAREGHPGWV